MSNNPSPRWLTYPEAAEHLGCSERQLRRWVSQGRVPYTRLGLRVLFVAEMLDAFVESHTYRPPVA